MKSLNVRKHAKKIKGSVPKFLQHVKTGMLMAYVIATVLSAYSGLMFYEGTQFATAHAASNMAHVTSPKASGR